MRGIDKDKIILDILREESKTKKELCDEAVKRGVAESTAYTHIKKLIRLGEIKEGKLELVTKIDEANRLEVDSCLELLIEDDNEHVIFSRLEQLTKLSWDMRLLHFPNVIQKIECLLDKKEIIYNERNLNQFFEALYAMLFFEQDRQGVKWEKITERLVNDTIEKASSLLLKRPNNHIIEYLGRTNHGYAVNVIFELMTKHNVEVDKNEFSHITNALKKDRLSKEHKKLIEEKLDIFLRTKDVRLIKLATTIRERIT